LMLWRRPLYSRLSSRRGFSIISEYIESKWLTPFQKLRPDTRPSQN
jgi:hypothetical protein